MPEPTIRRAGPDDAQALADIGAETFIETFGHLYPKRDLETFVGEAYARRRISADLADPLQASWLVEADGRTIGYASAGPCALPHPEVTADCGELKRIYLRTGWQGAGLGRRLFAEAIAWLERAGPRTIWIGVWSENHGALRFYAREGFSRAGEYGFRVGETVDREYILRRRSAGSSSRSANTASLEHNPA